VLNPWESARGFGGLPKQSETRDLVSDDIEGLDPKPETEALKERDKIARGNAPGDRVGSSAKP
jgi:hypothetical protein